MTSLLSQFVAFLIMLGTGLVVGLLFDIYRIIRSLTRPRAQGSIAMDLLFWVLITPVLFALLLAGNWGELRFYVFLGVGAGLFAYFQLASPLVLWALITFSRWLGRILGALLYMIARIAGFPVMVYRDGRLALWRVQGRLRSKRVVRQPQPHMRRWLTPQHWLPQRWPGMHGWLKPAVNLRISPPWGWIWPFGRR